MISRLGNFCLPKCYLGPYYSRKSPHHLASDPADQAGSARQVRLPDTIHLGLRCCQGDSTSKYLDWIRGSMGRQLGTIYKDVSNTLRGMIFCQNNFQKWIRHESIIDIWAHLIVSFSPKTPPQRDARILLWIYPS